MSEAYGDGPLRVAQGFRTNAEQDALYAQGRTTPGNIVTNARGGESIHNLGHAVDVFRVSGGNLYAPSLSTVETFKRFGFSWGGDCKGKLVDRPHFERSESDDVISEFDLMDQGSNICCSLLGSDV